MSRRHPDFSSADDDLEIIPVESPRGSALDEAKALITGDRNNQYGPPTQDFDRTAQMANGFGFSVNGAPIQAHHVALFVMLVKISRLAWTPQKRDSWVDIAGYAGCGYECAVMKPTAVVTEKPSFAEATEDARQETLKMARAYLGTREKKDA